MSTNENMQRYARQIYESAMAGQKPGAALANYIRTLREMDGAPEQIFAREYRISKARHTGHPDMRTIVEIFRDDDPLWANWKPTAEDIRESAEYGVDLTGLEGLPGLIEATCREQEKSGAKRIRVEVREVGPWQEVPR